MNNHPGPAEYLEIDFKAIRLKGYHPNSNKQHDYKTAKAPVDKGFTAPDFKGLSLPEIEQAVKEGYWIGWLVPDGYIVIDSENPAVISILDIIARQSNCMVQITNRGKQYMFHYDQKAIPASSEYLCAGGFPVTPRVARKNYVIMPPTNDRSWEQWTSPEKLPSLPELLYPYDRTNKVHIARCLAWAIGEAYREGRLAGWEDIDAAFMAYLFEDDLPTDVIQQCFKLVFMNAYDQKRTEEMYNRVKKLKEDGKKILGSGSFVKKIRSLKFKKIDKFLTVLNVTTKQSSNKRENSQRKGNTRPSQAKELIQIAEQYYLFHDELQQAYACINNEAYNVRGTLFYQFITRELYLSKGMVAGSEAIKQALGVIEGKANFEGKLIKLHNRIASHEGAFYYDMGAGRAVKITAAGWTIDNSPPILFKRYSHQLPQVEPQRGGEFYRIFSYFNITDEQDQLLLIVSLVCYLVPDIPHPSIYAHGGQGTGKTRGFSFAKKLIDPSKMEVFLPPHDKMELIQNLDHHYLCVFDNISNIPEWLSDVLSVAVTGGGQSKRKLYSDDDDIIFSYRRCIVLTGINMCIEKSDLFERTIIIRFDHIPPDQRKEETTLQKQFELELPTLLGSLFDVLSKAMKIYPTIKLKGLPRMADFCRWGCAITIASGYEMNDFLTAYENNKFRQHQEIFDSNTLAQTIVTFMRDKEEWTGYVGDLHKILHEIARITKEDRTFPTHSNKFRAHIERIDPNLTGFGIKVTIADSHDGSGTPVTIKKIKQCSSYIDISEQAEQADCMSPKMGDLFEDHENQNPDVHRDLHEASTCNHEDNNNPEDPEDQKPILKEELSPCYACGGSKYWQSVSHTGWICEQCHPPPNERIVAQRKHVDM